jgi:hypothetical protein
MTYGVVLSIKKAPFFQTGLSNIISGELMYPHKQPAPADFAEE